MAATKNRQLVVYEGGQVGEANAPPCKLRHFSHRHWLHRYQVQRRDNFECAVCEQPCTDVVYGCKSCSYYMHEPCFNLPQKIRLKCHRHPLTLHSTSTYAGLFECNACAGDGNGFNYNCSTCEYDLHVGCAAFPETLTTGFNYKITLYYSFPNKNEAAPLFCSICKKAVDKKYWLYFNRGTDLVYHVSCAFRERCEGIDVEDLISQASNRLGLLELKN